MITFIQTLMMAIFINGMMTCPTSKTVNADNPANPSSEAAFSSFVESEGWRGTAEECIVQRYISNLDSCPGHLKDSARAALEDELRFAYKTRNINARDVEEFVNSTQENSFSVQDRGPWEMLVITAARTYLNNNGYYLTVELINHFLAQTTPPAEGSYYVPTYGWRADYASASNAIIQSTAITGSSVFSSTSTTYEADLNYAIRHFSYNKKASNTKEFLLFDTYDFVYMEGAGFSDPVALANNVLYSFQESGECYPFDIRIKCAPVSSNISIGTYTDLLEKPYIIDNDISLGFSLNVSPHYDDAVLMTTGGALVAIHIYDYSDHSFIATYSGNGFSLNTLCKPTFSENITYYVIVRSYANALSSAKLIVFKSPKDADDFFSTDIINHTGNYSGTTLFASSNTFVIRVPSSGNYSFRIDNGNEEYAFVMDIINPITSKINYSSFQYLPTSSTINMYCSSAIDYLMLVNFEDYLDSGWTFNLQVGFVS